MKVSIVTISYNGNLPEDFAISTKLILLDSDELEELTVELSFYIKVGGGDVTPGDANIFYQNLQIDFPKEKRLIQMSTV